MESLNFFIYKLKQLKGISNKGIIKVLAGLPKDGWKQVSATEIMYLGQITKNYQQTFLISYNAFNEQVEAHFKRYQQQGFLTMFDEAYPVYLKEIYNPPVGLFFKGNVNLLSKPAIALVGARQASTYGKEVVNQLVPDLVKQKLVIVSGLAQGIDTCAHQQTIRNQGQTIAVIGSGLDQVYPKANKQLQRYIANYHLLISEYPLGTPPLPYHFPARNRIIAGLTQGTCIIEAKQQSGSLITAQLALEAGREVFAIPGSILTNESQGTHELIQQGAKCVFKSQDIIEEWLF